MNLPAYKSLYDFAQIETAIQSYFVAQGFVKPPNESDAGRESWTPSAGTVAFFTAFEAAIFQKSTPRVAAFLSGINAVKPAHHISDNNGALRNRAWRGTLTLEIITEPNYTTHTDLRNLVMALGEMIAPLVANPTGTPRIGANQYLTVHQIAYVEPQNLDTSIQISEGFYGSQLTYQITFSIPTAAILAVIET